MLHSNYKKLLSEAQAKILDLENENLELKAKDVRYNYPGPNYTESPELVYFEAWGIFKSNGEMCTWCATKAEAEAIMLERYHALLYINKHQHLYRIPVMKDERELTEEANRFAGKFGKYVHWKTHYVGNNPSYMTPKFNIGYKNSYIMQVRMLRGADGGTVVSPWNGWEITEVE